MLLVYDVEEDFVDYKVWIICAAIGMGYLHIMKIVRLHKFLVCY